MGLGISAADRARIVEDCEGGELGFLGSRSVSSAFPVLVMAVVACCSRRARLCVG